MRLRLFFVIALVGAGTVVAAHTSHIIGGAEASAPVVGHAGMRGPTRIYKLASTAEKLSPLDAWSLDNETNGRSFAIGPRSFLATRDAPTIQTSVNGTKFAVQFTRRGHSWSSKLSQVTLQVFNARNGSPLWPRVHPQVPFILLGVSGNGSRLFGARAGGDLNKMCSDRTFYVLDSRTGRVVRTVSVRESHMWEPMLIGPSLRYVYVLNEPDQASSCGVWHGPVPTLTSYDLSSNRSPLSIRLTHIQGGSWTTGLSGAHGNAVTSHQTPGFALSPDGSQVAVLDGSTEALTLLNAKTLKIETSETLYHAASTWDRLAGALGLAPVVAHAKELQGTELQMRYTPNGRSLLVTGGLSRIEPSTRSPAQVSLGIRLIDVATGRVIAEQSGQKQIYSFWSAPDGAAVYTLAGIVNPQMCPCTVQRRDPASLRVLSSRTFWDDTGLDIYVLSARK